MAARIISVGDLVWIQANYVPYAPYDEPCFVTNVNVTNLGWNVYDLLGAGPDKVYKNVQIQRISVEPSGSSISHLNAEAIEGLL